MGHAIAGGSAKASLLALLRHGSDSTGFSGATSTSCSSFAASSTQGGISTGSWISTCRCSSLAAPGPGIAGLRRCAGKRPPNSPGRHSTESVGFPTETDNVVESARPASLRKPAGQRSCKASSLITMRHTTPRCRTKTSRPRPSDSESAARRRSCRHRTQAPG